MYGLKGPWSLVAIGLPAPAFCLTAWLQNYLLQPSWNVVVGAKFLHLILRRLPLCG
jgi:hypothetical protein